MKRFKKLLAGLSAVAAATLNASALTIQAPLASIKQMPEGHLLSNGETAEYLNISAAGDYRVTVVALGQPAGGVWPEMALSIDGLPYERTSVVTPTMQWTNYVFNVRLSAAVHSVGVQYMNDAIINGEDRNLGLLGFHVDPLNGAPQPALSTRAAWVAAGPARDSHAVAQANAAIPAHRMDPARVQVVDKSGAPVANAQVTVEQVTSDFLFGASIASWKAFGTQSLNDAYANKFADVFNYATVPFYWPLTEPVQNVYDFARIDEQVNFAVSQGMQVKAHAPIWNAPYILPSWANGVLPGLSKQQSLISKLMQRYSGTVRHWEIVNEPMNAGGDYTAPSQWARGLNAGANLILNEYGHFYQGMPQFYEFVENLRAQGAQIDTLGIQAHAPTDMAFPLEYVQWNLDQLASLGARLHITEFTPPSSGIPVSGAFWRGNWSEAVQAAYAAEFYRVCFAHPAVSAITWWDVTDKDAWVPGGGLLRGDLSEKPAYAALKQLITNEWRTRLSQKTAGNGSLGFDGFHGRYRVTVTVNGETKTAEFQLSEGGANTVTVALSQGPSPQAPAPTVTVAPQRTKLVRPTLSGSASDATSVSVSLNGSTWYTAAVANGAWSLTMPVNVANGVYNVRAKATGPAGTATDSSTGELIVDSVAPVISVSGSSYITLKRRASYTDAGATAIDNIDGNVTGRIVTSGSVNTSKPGFYYITYTCSDHTGNTSTKKRTIRVN